MCCSDPNIRLCCPNTLSTHIDRACQARARPQPSHLLHLGGRSHSTCPFSTLSEQTGPTKKIASPTLSMADMAFIAGPCCARNILHLTEVYMTWFMTHMAGPVGSPAEPFESETVFEVRGEASQIMR